MKGCDMKALISLYDSIIFFGLFGCAVTGLVWLSMLNQQFSAEQLGLVKHGALPTWPGEQRDMTHPLVVEQDHDVQKPETHAAGSERRMKDDASGLRGSGRRR
jgi:hypothetical protein